jgi:hypothetical protein
MITLFNRKELCNVFSMKEQSNIREILSNNNVDYKIRTINRMSSSSISSGTRVRTGTFGQNLNLNYEYIFYVHKNDFDKAVQLIGR